ncbi:O-antigen ligase family protein [Aquihabitans sp. G128]|uniref:O-antigen ligase family protein n=1 Tax=Aquihabitans sp. G128 TaxID=2849779 RepID=UPI001C21D475|nr:O-antigen ligase family protein [Aquihabitans sp. G128]QXC59134.1 O-antigen ligase family protein [Aquihabitans sp. G128]
MTATRPRAIPAADPPAPPATPVAPRRTLRPTRATWPVWAITAGMPLAFLLGVHGIVWPIVAFALAGRVLFHRETRYPWSTIPLMIFVCWIPLSFSMTKPSSLPIFTYRFSLFLGCLAAAVWVANVSEERVPTQRIVDWLAALWICTIAFGYLAQVMPHLDMGSPFTTLMGPIGRINFLARISDWHLADNQDFLDHAFSRPAAPWAAANSWGAAVGILTPFFVRSWLIDVDRRRRKIGLVLLAASIIPILTSANRGLWIGLIVGLVYYAARKALRGRFGALAVLFGAIGVVGILLVATPAGSLVQSRLGGSGDSNEARSELYVDSWKGAVDSPLVGNGVPRETNYYKNSPPVGTHGLLWYLMFIHGFVGLALFLTWLGIETFRSGLVRTPLGWWAHLSIVITVVELPYYGLLPHIIVLGLAVGIAHRESRRAVPAAAA